MSFYFSVIDKLDEVDNIDLVCCLNVLDRCADPHQILKDIHRALSPEGRAIIALVLPYSHYVETSEFIAAVANPNPNSFRIIMQYSSMLFRRYVAFAD